MNCVVSRNWCLEGRAHSQMPCLSDNKWIIFNTIIKAKRVFPVAETQFWICSETEIQCGSAPIVLCQFSDIVLDN